MSFHGAMAILSPQPKGQNFEDFDTTMARDETRAPKNLLILHLLAAWNDLSIINNLVGTLSVWI